MESELLKRICELQERKEKAALVTIVETRGSTPRKAGSRMLILPDGRSYGTIGGGCGEAEVRR
ncbi:MAG: XdhC family protein, partial [Bacillota bacterium]